MYKSLKIKEFFVLLVQKLKRLSLILAQTQKQQAFMREPMKANWFFVDLVFLKNTAKRIATQVNVANLIWDIENELKINLPNL